MKHVILQNGPLSPWLEEQLNAKYEVLPLHKQADQAGLPARARRPHRGHGHLGQGRRHRARCSTRCPTCA
jgi:hypothetical protein